MPFIYNNTDIRDRRIKWVIDTLHKSFTKLMIIDREAQMLIDEEIDMASIAALALSESETSPVLPLGTELVFQFDSLGLDFDSDSKFIVETHDGQDRLDILELDYAEVGEVLPEGTSKLDNNLKIKDGFIIFKNLELYDYTYQSYEIINEIYRAVEIFFNSVESFYSRFYIDEIEETNSIILVYDTSDIDTELETVIFPIADTITNEEDREAVKLIYESLRDRIKFWAMSVASRLDEEINNLLFCINGSKKYSVQKNIETKQLELLIDENGYSRRVHKDEPIFFPFHNKPKLDEFTRGIQGIY